MLSIPMEEYCETSTAQSGSRPLSALETQSVPHLCEPNRTLRWKRANRERETETERQSRAVTYVVVGRGVLKAAVVGGALVLLLHEDGGLVGRQEGGGPVQVLVEVVLPLV